MRTEPAPECDETERERGLAAVVQKKRVSGEGLTWGAEREGFGKKKRYFLKTVFKLNMTSLKWYFLQWNQPSYLWPGPALIFTTLVGVLGP